MAESACISNVRNECHSFLIKGVSGFGFFGVVGVFLRVGGWGLVLGFRLFFGFFLFRTFAFFCGISCDLYFLHKACCVIGHSGQHS